MDFLFILTNFPIEPNEIIKTVNFSSDLVGGLLGAIISGVFAILVFYFGIKAEKRKEDSKDNSHQTDIQNFIITSLDVVTKGLIKQSDHLVVFTREIRKRDFMEKALFMEVSFKTSGIKSIPNPDVFKMFINRTNNGVEAYKKFQNNIELLNGYEKSIPLSLKEFNEIFRKTQDSFGESIKSIQGVYDRSISKFGNQALQLEFDVFIAAWRKIIKGWLAKESENNSILIRDPYFVYDHLIKPLKKLIREQYFDSRIIEIMDHVKNCEFQLMVYDQARISFSKRFLKMARNMVHASIELNQVLSELKENRTN